MQAHNGNEIIPRPDGTVIEREIRKGSDWIFYSVVHHGPNTYQFLASSNRVVAAQARVWAQELGKGAGLPITGGGGWNGTPGGGNHAYNCKVYSFA